MEGEFAAKLRELQGLLHDQLRDQRHFLESKLTPREPPRSNAGALLDEAEEPREDPSVALLRAQVAALEAELRALRDRETDARSAQQVCPYVGAAAG